MLQSIGSQRVGHYRATEQQQNENINTITLVGLGDFICNNLSVTSTFIVIKKKKKIWDFPGGPVELGSHSQLREPGFDPQLGN